jgi:hypothetical protein
MLPFNPWKVAAGVVALAIVAVIGAKSLHAIASRQALGLPSIETVRGNLVDERRQMAIQPAAPQKAPEKVVSVPQHWYSLPTPYAQPTPCELCREREARYLARLHSDGVMYPVNGVER